LVKNRIAVIPAAHAIVKPRPHTTDIPAAIIADIAADTAGIRNTDAAAAAANSIRRRVA